MYGCLDPHIESNIIWLLFLCQLCVLPFLLCILPFAFCAVPASWLHKLSDQFYAELAILYIHYAFSFPRHNVWDQFSLAYLSFYNIATSNVYI